MQKFLTLFVLFYSMLTFAQSQLGLTSSVNITSVKSDDLLGIQTSAGFGVGLTALFPFHKTSDWMISMSYNFKGISIEGYKNFDNQEVTINSNNRLRIESLDLDFIINQYIIVPENDFFHIGVQAGLGTTLLNTWKQEEITEVINNDSNFSPYYILGMVGGTEQYRIHFRYNGFLGKPLENLGVDELPDDNNRFDTRLFEGTLSNFSISLTYFFKTFSY